MSRERSELGAASTTRGGSLRPVVAQTMERSRTGQPPLHLVPARGSMRHATKRGSARRLMGLGMRDRLYLVGGPWRSHRLPAFDSICVAGMTLRIRWDRDFYCAAEQLGMKRESTRGHRCDDNDHGCRCPTRNAYTPLDRRCPGWYTGVIDVMRAQAPPPRQAEVRSRGSQENTRTTERR